MLLNPDVITMLAVSAGALALLAVTAPRWDTGSGAMMMLILGGVSFPLWGPVLMVVCIVYLTGMLGVLAWWCALPFWWITKPLWRRFYYSFRHRRGEEPDVFWKTTYFSELAE